MSVLKGNFCISLLNILPKISQNLPQTAIFVCKILLLLTSIRMLKSAQVWCLGGTRFLFGSPLTKCPIICTLNFMLNYPIIFELQADYLLEKILDNGKYRTEKWRFVPFVSILTTCLCSKHKATLPYIFPFIILIKTYN